MKHIHFIGICGVAMSALAVAFQKKGWKVTGSDAGFFPPISDYLKDNKINFYPGWHPDFALRVAPGKPAPDIIVVGNAIGSTNPEFCYAKDNNLNYKSYPEVIAEFIVQKNSVVCAGTYGKTTSAALLAWIFENAKLRPSYMFGGISLNLPESARLADERTRPGAAEGEAGPCLAGAFSEGGWSILEGDEYKTAKWDNRPKFKLYSPVRLLLTSVIWDHADFYPTEKGYLDAFADLARSLPERGLLVACKDGPNVMDISKESKCKVITYGKSGADYVYALTSQSANGVCLEINQKGKKTKLASRVLGEHMAENICGCFAMAKEAGIEEKIIKKSIASFRGLKRRLEKRYEGMITVYDDLAHSPAKAKAALKTLRSIYPAQKIIAVFEPNSGNRKSASFPGYKNAFNDADEVVLPSFTKLKTDPNDPDPPCDGDKLARVIQKNHQNVYFIADDEELVKRIKDNVKKEDVVVFLGSHGFRGMMEKLFSLINHFG